MTEQMTPDEVLAPSVIENALRATKEQAEAGGKHGRSHCTISGKLFECVSGGTDWRVDGVMKSFVEVLYESGLLVEATAVAALIARNAELEAQTPSALREKIRSCEEALAAAEAERDALRDAVKIADKYVCCEASEDDIEAFMAALARTEAGHG